MIIVCPTCSTRLQVEDRTSSKPLSVRCPKCSKTISLNSVSPVSDQGALAVGGSPSTAHARFEPNNTAVPYASPNAVHLGNAPQGVEDALRLLLEMLGKGVGPSPNVSPSQRPAWNKRKILVCTQEKYRERIASPLSEANFEVYIAQDTRQGVETMRNRQLDVVFLDPEFDPAEQGAAFVVREINILRPVHRRRVFVTLLSSSLRTMDAHSAFLNNVNLVVNVADLDQLPRILEISMRDFNELYKDFFAISNQTAL